MTATIAGPPLCFPAIALDNLINISPPPVYCNIEPNKIKIVTKFAIIPVISPHIPKSD